MEQVQWAARGCFSPDRRSSRTGREKLSWWQQGEIQRDSFGVPLTWV